MSQILKDSQELRLVTKSKAKTPLRYLLEQFFKNSQFLSICNLNVVLVSSHKLEVLFGNQLCSKPC